MAACSRDPAAGVKPTLVPFARGDAVVVEQTAATFFETRILQVETDKLRVENSTDTGSVLISLADVYRLPPSPSLLQSGQVGICNAGAKSWVACRVRALKPDNISAEDADGKVIKLEPRRFLSPTPVTELNLRRHFERARERAEFTRAANKAGSPRAPAGWRAAPRERVVVRQDSAWFSARVHEIEDDGLRVAWDADGQVQKVAFADVVPLPPYKSAVFRPGDFALIRPLGPAQFWRQVQVRGSGDGQLEVSDINGASEKVAARDLLPLSAE